MKKQVKRKSTKDDRNKKTTFGDIHNQYNSQVDLINPTRKQTKPAPKKKPNAEYQRKKNNRKNEFYTKLFALFVFVLFVFYIGGYFAVLMNRETISSTTVLSGAIGQPSISKGVIIRDETVYNAPAAGNVQYFVADNEKIKSGTVVASIQNSDNIDDILIELDNLDQKIYELQERRDDFSIAQKDAKRIAGQIKTGIDNTMFDFSTYNMDSIYKTKSGVDKKVSVRNQRLLQEDTGSVKSLSGERQMALDKFEENETPMKVVTSGIVSYYIDGFEDRFNFTNLYSLSKEHIKSATNDKTVVTSKEVIKEDKVFKLINSNTWYIASYVDPEAVEDWKEGEAKRIAIENSQTYHDVDVIVDRIITKQKEAYVVFKITNKVLDYINMREVNIKITGGADEGIKVPNSAVAEMLLLKIPKKYIYGKNSNLVNRMVNNEVKEVAISKYLSDEENIWVLQKYSIIQYGDIIVSAEDSSDTFKVEESMNIYGVYKINSGLAKFARIYIKEVSDGFTILDPDVEQGISSHDVIVTDAINVEEGQKIYKKN